MRTDENADENYTFEMKASAFLKLIFGYLAFFLTQIRKTFKVWRRNRLLAVAEQVGAQSNVGIELVYAVDTDLNMHTC